MIKLVSKVPFSYFLAIIFLVIAVSLGVHKLASHTSASAELQPVHDVSDATVPRERQNNRENEARIQGGSEGYQVVEQEGTGHAAEKFHQERARLMHARRELVKQLVDSSPEKRDEAMELWDEENSEALDAQQQLAIQMAAESEPPRFRVPTAPRIPENATPELREFLTARHAVMKDRAEMMDQLRDYSGEERHQAMEKWHEKNTSRLEAMQTTASRLTEARKPSGTSAR